MIAPSEAVPGRLAADHQATGGIIPELKDG